MPKYPENLIHFCRPVLEHYELSFEMGRMFVRSMFCRRIGQVLASALEVVVCLHDRGGHRADRTPCRRALRLGLVG
eukprot:COSAG05_NODE_304_length_11730_cov_494.101539_5_plen_76_part_00